MRARSNVFTLPERIYAPSLHTLLVILSSLLTIGLTFIVAVSGAAVSERLILFATVLAAYLGTCGLIYRNYVLDAAAAERTVRDNNFESALAELDEANELIAHSLPVEDAFRLISSRLNRHIGGNSGMLYLLDEQRTGLRRVAAFGEDVPADTQEATELARESFTAKEIKYEKGGHPGGRGRKSRSSIAAIPLMRGTEAIGVLQVYFGAGARRPYNLHFLLEAIGRRITPLVLSAINFERNQAGALTDRITMLPNQRAFYLVIEKQIAESAPDPECRPLSILMIDIVDFEVIMKKYGPSAGDRVLSYAGRVARENLRSMDSIARLAGAEFVAVLPTASAETMHEIIERLERAFLGSKVAVTELDAIDLRVRIGWAAFGDDGETPKSLLAAARVRKDRQKDPQSRKVLMFRN